MTDAIPTAVPVAVLDTNVFLDLYSAHEFRNLDALYQAHGEAAFTLPATTYRLARARDALLLAICFHETRAATWAPLHSEVVALMTRKSPPDVGEARTFESAFVETWLWFVRERVLDGWADTMPGEPDGLGGNAACR